MIFVLCAWPDWGFFWRPVDGKTGCEFILLRIPQDKFVKPKGVRPEDLSFAGGFMRNWYVYLVDKKEKLYVGVTTDLPNRMR